MPNESFGFDITSKTEAGQIFEMSHRKNRTPSISTGEVTPFGWTVSDPVDDDQWRISANLTGEFELSLEPLR